jgi:hypothetical protein
MESLDKLSLELLTNRRKYNKTMDKMNGSNLHNEYIENCNKYKTDIIIAIKEYLLNELSYNAEIDELLPVLMKHFIKYFDMKEMEKKNRGWQMDGPDEEECEEGEDYEEKEGNEEDDELLFSNIKENKEESTIKNEFMNSYWGKSYIKKL